MADSHHLDLHCRIILEEYQENLPLFQQKAEQLHALLKKTLADAGLIVASLERG